jgi:hypothetical protein
VPDKAASGAWFDFSTAMNAYLFFAGCRLAGGVRCFYSPAMSIEQLKAELRAASPETQEELFTLLAVLRRAGDPQRPQRLAEKLDDPARWVSEEEAARRLGLEGEKR